MNWKRSCYIMFTGKFGRILYCLLFLSKINKGYHFHLISIIRGVNDLNRNSYQDSISTPWLLIIATTYTWRTNIFVYIAYRTSHVQTSSTIGNYNSVLYFWYRYTDVVENGLRKRTSAVKSKLLFDIHIQNYIAVVCNTAKSKQCS